MTHNKLLFSSICFLLLIFFGCSKDDESTDGNSNNFDATLLEKSWAIFQGEFEDEVFDVPVTSAECGRDFFIFEADGTYTDFVVSESFDCTPQTTTLSWSLMNETLTLSDNLGQSEKIRILQLTSTLFVFEILIDIDEDGTDDKVVLTARPYVPPTIDNVSFTFQQNFSVSDRIEFTWQSYSGAAFFDRYEIYRSKSCSRTELELIATITERDTEVFVDESAEGDNQICYLLKIYTDQGELGESELLSVDTFQIVPAAVEFETANIINEQIELNWKLYEGFYFSHYEIYVRNYEPGVIGFGVQEVLIAKIDDVNTTSYLDTNTPYIKNPIYIVRVVNRFGNSTAFFPGESIQIEYQRPGTLNLESIWEFTYDPNEPELYFWGLPDIGNGLNLMKYNYENDEFIVSNDPPDSSSIEFLKIIDSEFGKELFVLNGFDVDVYDANSLNLKYSLRRKDSFLSIKDIEYSGNGIWLVTDSQSLYTFSREEALLTSIEEVDLSIDLQYGPFQIIKLNENRILVGHESDLESYTLKIGVNGEITDRVPIIGLEWKDYERNLSYNEASNIVVDIEDKDIYEASNFNITQSFDRPTFPTGLSIDGAEIFGHENNPDYIYEDDTRFERKMISYNISSENSLEKTTLGYPHFVFQNRLGQTVSISSWFIRQSLRGSGGDFPDLFVEIVE